MADNARAAEWETIRPEDDGRLFYQKKTWQKLIIMAGGPTMNLLLAFAILLGRHRARTGCTARQLTVNRVQECIVAGGRDRPDAAPASRRRRRTSPASSPATRSWPSTAVPVHDWDADVAG